MNVLLLLAGSSNAFKQAGYTYPKSLVEVGGEAMIDKVIRCLDPLMKRGGKLIAAVRRDENQAFHLGAVVRLIVPDARLVEIESDTGGAACTALVAIEHINNDEPLIIANGDQIFDVDLSAAIADFEKRHLDGGTIVFRGIHPRWSFVRVNDEGLVEEAAEKRPISRLATAGFYYFARGRDFVDAACAMLRKEAAVDGLYYVCPAFNQMILKGARIGIVEIAASEYHSLATPALVESYEAVRHPRGIPKAGAAHGSP